MIKPLVLGKRSFSSNLIQGPLAGISCAPFRRLIWKYSQPAFTCTEMISCKTLIYNAKISHPRYIVKAPDEGPVCFQLASNDPHELGEAVKRVTDYGADLIDLNCGCPVKKIRSKGAGSSLLTQPEKLDALITAMKQNTHVPISIKVRVEHPNYEKFNDALIQVIQNSGVDFVTVHGRHWSEHYETPCRHEAIQYFVEHLKIPVIGNGDIGCLNSLNRMFVTGCDGAMVARHGVGQPWLFAKLTAEMQGQSYQPPSLPEMAELFLEHVSGLIELLKNEKFAILQARKFAKYYGRSLVQQKLFHHEIAACESMNELIRICHKFFF